MRAVRALTAEPFERIPLRPSTPRLLGAVIVLALADLASQLSGNTLMPGAPADETAHVVTALPVLCALGPTATRRFALGALTASFAIDVDHLPSHLGTDFLTAGSLGPTRTRC